MKRLLVVAILLLVTRFGITTGTYDGGLNAGVWVQAFGSCFGYETSGLPGPWMEPCE